MFVYKKRLKKKLFWNVKVCFFSRENFEKELEDFEPSTKNQRTNNTVKVKVALLLQMPLLFASTVYLLITVLDSRLDCLQVYRDVIGFMIGFMIGVIVDTLV